MHKSLFITCTLLFSTIFLGCSESKEASSELNEMVSSNDFVLSSTKNQTYTITKEANDYILHDTKKHVVIFDVFATWCPPCRASIPHLSELQKKYDKDILILGISIDEDMSNADLDAFATKHKASYPIMNAKDNRKLASSIASSLGAGQDFGIPFMSIYVDGKYFTHYNGAVPPEMIEADIKRALGQ